MCKIYSGFIRASENVRDPVFLDDCPRNGLSCPRNGLSCPRIGLSCPRLGRLTVRDLADYLSKLAHGTDARGPRGRVNKGSNTRNRENRPTWIYLPPLILPWYFFSFFFSILFFFFRAGSFLFNKTEDFSEKRGGAFEIWTFFVCVRDLDFWKCINPEIYNLYYSVLPIFRYIADNPLL